VKAGQAIKDSDIILVAIGLQAHVRVKLRLNPDASEEQLVHHYLAALDLTPTEHRSILDEYRRRRRPAKKKDAEKRSLSRLSWFPHSSLAGFTETEGFFNEYRPLFVNNRTVSLFAFSDG
jgi:hypothetical protein